MKKIFSGIYLVIILIFTCAYTFPDKLPDCKNINLYLPQKLKFQKTSVKEFNALAPKSKTYDAGKGIKIIKTTPVKTDVFKEINVGFSNNVLDWIEFVFSKKIKMNEFTAEYGYPEFINAEHSDKLDYFDYDVFNISTDKKHEFANSITIFEIKASAQKNTKIEAIKPSGTKTFFEIFPDLKPGIMTENEFETKFPGLLPYMEEESDINYYYTLIEELNAVKHLYKKAELHFENGILSWINLTPVNADLKFITDKVKTPYKIEQLNNKYVFYTFDNFTLIVDKKQKKVSSIGVFNFDKRF
ncbi:MAG TPA: hypothetical protein P5556_08735 [Candidatus Gastranaerophilales bacterium]|nr:hypothetical protein [Candidatus Gastranaerophilales bacterium]